MIDSTRRVLAVTVVLAVVFVVSAWSVGGFGDACEPNQDLCERTWLVRDVALLALNTLPLLALRRNPLAVVLVLCVAYPLWLIAGHEPQMFQSLPMLAGLYVVGSWSRALWLRAVGLVAPVWMVVAVVTGFWPDAGLLEVGYIAVMFALAWAIGVVIAARRSYAEQLEAKAVALEAARRELAERAVADERARIARELHDVIAHAMSVITVRAGVGAHLLGAGADGRVAGSPPAEAAKALAVIERTGREALSEMRRMLAVLRDPDPQARRPDPQPGLADLPRLVEQVGAAGVAVMVTTEGTARQRPAGLDLAAYRVIQEALTNVAKHAPGARALVTVRHRADSLEIEVRNPGRSLGPVTPGQGLRGMAERVALYDGRFDAGPDRDGFRVSAQFPLEPGELEA
jgi:signal transduction histidine kinase